MKFEKYPSIENAYREKTINYIIEEGLSAGYWVVTEKVHGANFQFSYNGTTMKYGKRTGYIGENEEVNMGFFRADMVVDENRDKIILIYNQLKEYLGLDTFEVMTVYGELFGGVYPDLLDIEAKQVQKGIYYHPGNKFYAFDIKLDDYFVDFNLFEVVCKRAQILYSKSLFTGTFEECLKFPNDLPSTIYKELGLREVPNNIMEGVVIKPQIHKLFGNGERVILKNKNEKWSENVKTHKSPPKIEPKLLPETEEMMNIALDYVNENRLRNCLSKIGTVTNKDFGRVSGIFIHDAIKDFLTDHQDKFTLLEENQRKLITKRIGSECATLLRRNILNVIDGNF